MATLQSVIALVDELQPNPYSPDTKTAWVNAVEGRVQLNILLTDIKEVKVYDWWRDQDTVLLVEPPHDDLYVLWLRAQIHAANGEWDEYANALEMYNAAYGDFLRWFAGRYHPANGYAAPGGGSDNPPYYLTAYGLAVKNGYTGTEAEWLASLVGPQGEPFTYDDFTPEQLAALKGETGKDGADGADGQDAMMPISYINPRLSGYPPRYHYEIYTPWESLPDSFLFMPYLNYGMQSGDGWGMTIYTSKSSGWTATATNFDGWDVSDGYKLFAYSGGTVKTVRGEPGKDGNDGEAGPQGADGQRGTGLLNITTAPSSYTTAIGGFAPTYRISLSTVLTQSKMSEVLVGDTLRYSYYLYPVGYVDSSYVYLGAGVSIRGATGATGATGPQGPQGPQGESGGAQKVVVYENAAGISSLDEKIAVVDPSNYDYFIVHTSHGTFPIYRSDNFYGYITGGTIASTNGGITFHVVSACFSPSESNPSEWTIRSNGYFPVNSNGNPTWSPSLVLNKIYKITGVKL